MEARLGQDGRVAPRQAPQRGSRLGAHGLRAAACGQRQERARGLRRRKARRPGGRLRGDVADGVAGIVLCVPAQQSRQAAWQWRIEASLHKNRL